MNLPDNISRAESASETQLAKERKSAIDLYKTQGLIIESFTCDDCAARYNCRLAFDAYNTNGDCIAEK